MDVAMRAVAPEPTTSSAPSGSGQEKQPPGMEERNSVVEGLSRVVAALPPQAMGEAGLALTAPLVRRAQAFAQAGGRCSRANRL